MYDTVGVLCIEAKSSCEDQMDWVGPCVMQQAGAYNGQLIDQPSVQGSLKSPASCMISRKEGLWLPNFMTTLA